MFLVTGGTMITMMTLNGIGNAASIFPNTGQIQMRCRRRARECPEAGAFGYREEYCLLDTNLDRWMGRRWRDPRWIRRRRRFFDLRLGTLD